MIEGFMVEARWFNGGNAPNLEEYIENGVSTAGAYMALVHLFFLIGEGVTDQNASLLTQKPYPNLFSSAGRILRLWDDLGTAKVCTCISYINEIDQVKGWNLLCNEPYIYIYI